MTHNDSKSWTRLSRYLGGALVLATLAFATNAAATELQTDGDPTQEAPSPEQAEPIEAGIFGKKKPAPAPAPAPEPDMCDVMCKAKCGAGNVSSSGRYDDNSCWCQCSSAPEIIKPQSLG